MKPLHKLFAIALMVLTFSLPVFADGQMETPKPQSAASTDGVMDTPLTDGLCRNQFR